MQINQIRNNTFLIWIVLVILITSYAAFWRFGNLGGDSFWHDEVITVRNALLGWDGFTNEPHHPPLLHILTVAALKMLGQNEWSARLPSAITGVMAIPLMALFGLIIQRPRVGLWAALFLALSPFHLRYSQDARYYALLTAFSLATFILLYLALTRRKFAWWFAFALATTVNLYTHYGAFVVLAWQSLFIAAWLLRLLLQRDIRALFYPFVAAAVVFVLYLKWIPQLLLALRINIGETATGGAGDVALIQTWVSQAFVAFGYGWSILPFLTAFFCVLGFITWISQREWMIFSFAATGLFAPLLLIIGFNVARWALPKYVIYMFPFYLLAAAVGLDALLHRMTYFTRNAYTYGAIMVTVAFLTVTWPLLQQEHDYIERDWKGVSAYLGEVAKEGDLFVSMSLDLSNGYNQGNLIFPYYLDQTFKDYRFLASNQLQPQDLQPFVTTDSDVWFLLLNRVIPIEFQKNSAQVKSFQGSIFLVSPTQTGSVLDKTISMYNQMISMAVSPSPQCLLQHDLATMYVVKKDFLTAKQWATEARAQCADNHLHEPNVYLLQNKIYRGLLEHYAQTGEIDKLHETEAQARQIALEGLRREVRDREALDLLTFENLLQRFENGIAQIELGSSPEPVELRRFSMPQNGDWGDVLFIHPGAKVSYQIELPQEPTALTFRAAMDPQSWGWGGDGSTFVVHLATDTRQFELFRQHISNEVNDQHWHDFLVSLEDYAGQTVTITLLTEPGPQDDLIGDWAGWDTPRIIWK